MGRYHFRRALRAARLSPLEEGSLVTGLLVPAAVVIAIAVGDVSGLARLVGTAGLFSIAVCAASRGVRGYRAGLTASIPATVGRARVRLRPRRAFSAVTIACALGLPLVAAVAALALVPWAWLLLSGVLLLGCAGSFVRWVSLAADHEYRPDPPEVAGELLRRLCMVADMPVPELSIESGPVASAWTARGRIHVTRRTLSLLDDAELEAVLAHEVAHLAHRDAAVMDVCSAPSGILFGFARALAPERIWRWVRACFDVGLSAAGLGVLAAILALLLVPPALVIGWLSRLSVLGLSRAREFSADAAAAALTGRPSALASALLKLDEQREWAPRSDLRQFDAQSVLCIVGTARSGLGRLFSSHPPTAARVGRLEQLESRVQPIRPLSRR